MITLIFEVDSLYDAKGVSFSQSKVKSLHEKMSCLLSESSPMTQPAIERFFQAMKEESIGSTPNCLKDYLQVSRYSIGAEILSNYIAYFLQIPSEIWFSKKISQFNEEIYTLIRLANDYLDVKSDQSRIEQEKVQIKAPQFFSNLLCFKLYFYWLYVYHKLHYYYKHLNYKLCRINQPEKEHYLKAILVSESLLIWAYKVYVIDQNSVHDV